MTTTDRLLHAQHRTLAAAVSVWTAVLADRTAPWRDDRGEGVISTAIAVLIVAFLGVAAYAIFNGLLGQAGSAASRNVSTYSG